MSRQSRRYLFQLFVPISALDLSWIMINRRVNAFLNHFHRKRKVGNKKVCDKNKFLYIYILYEIILFLALLFFSSIGTQIIT